MTSVSPALTVPAQARTGLPLAIRSARVALTYFWRHRRWPSLSGPRLFTEWVQWRKLHDRRDGLARLTDKLKSKLIASSALGPAMVVPTLWSGKELPSVPPGPYPLMVKANHGCGHHVVVRSDADWQRARRRSRDWMRVSYGAWLDEWHYGAARRLLIVEPMLGEGGGLPVDFKIYVLGGRAVIVQVHEGRGGNHRWAQMDLDWRPLSRRTTSVVRPASLEAMIDAAERLSSGHDMLRVDFYEIAGQPLFGEFCLFPGSGLDPFDPPELDDWLGMLWTEARGLSGIAERGCDGVDGQLDPVADAMIGFAAPMPLQ
ncbi:polysaccharide biosynthesis protein [Sphingomonas rhizophila]|uniref:Polysaccharide biosynthesis protein n=1 Tax=Sphingomonas rhizophila TaxID=2071607 RepID=A0A7G9SD12_9SPHN|nr:ATP-grasp fold amidoligase family protein [Sphingomonas rhizophila]QNN65737.1 polysaccharide biosynthesis protein [Sphingomonas rhizophila]